MSNSLPNRPETSISNRTAPKRRQRINVWLLLVTAAVLFILAPSLYFWYYFQTQRLANSFLERAEELLNENNPHAAAESLQRYLQIKPEDGDVRVRLAETYDQSATDLPSKRRAIELYFQALGWAGEDKAPTLRCRVGDLLLETMQYATAEKETEKLLKEVQLQLNNRPQDQGALKLQAQGMRVMALAIYGQCQMGSWNGSDNEKRSVSEIIEDALKLNPGDRVLVQTITKIYREEPQWLSADQQSLSVEERNNKADLYMDELVTAHPEDPEALLTRYYYKLPYNPPEAAKDLELALRFGQQNPRVLLAKADAEQAAARQMYQKSGRMDDASSLFDSAAKYYQQVLQSVPDKLNAENSKDKQSKEKLKLNAKNKQPQEKWWEIQQHAFANLGMIQQLQGQTNDALKIWKMGLEKIPNSTLLNLLATDALLNLGRTDEAAPSDKSKGQEGPLDVLEGLLTRLSSGAGQNFPLDNQEVKYRSEVYALQQSVRLLRGRWHFQRGELPAALPILQQVAQGEKNSVQQTNAALQAYRLLGEIYFRLDQPDQAITASENAATLNLRTSQPHLAAAKAWESLGRFDLAEKQLRQALDLQDSPQVKFQLAQTLFRRELQNPKTRRQWGDFEKALRAALEVKAELDSSASWELDYLEIQSACVRRQDESDPATAGQETLPKLNALEGKYPDNANLQEALVLAYESLQSPAEADRLMAKLIKLKPHEANTYLLQARLASLRRQFDQSRSALEEGIRQAPTTEQASLSREIIRLNLTQNREKEAAEQLQTLLKARDAGTTKPLDPETINLVLAFSMQALGKQNLPEAIRWEDELVRLEGPDGSLWRYCRVMRLLATVKDSNGPQFDEAERLLTELRKLRSSWPQRFLLEGLFLQRRGKLEEAVDAYENAIHFGYRQIDVYERLVTLLNLLGRYTDAERCLAGLEDQLPGSTILSSLQISRSTEKGQWRQAIDLAHRTADTQLRDPQAAIVFSRLLEMDNQLDKAEETLQNALQSAPGDPAIHYQLLAYYARNGKTKLANDHLDKLKDDAKIPPADRARLLAQGYELVQDTAKAKTAWNNLINFTKDAPQEQTALAEQLISRDPEAAEKALRQVLKTDPTYSRARRLLAQLLAIRGGESEWHEALSLLSNHSNPQEERLYQALQALIYASRGGKKNLEQAHEMMEKLVSDPNLARAEDVMLLAQICESEGKLEQAQTYLQTLVRNPHSTAPQVAAYVGLLLRSGLPQDEDSRQKMKEETGFWLKKLQELAPDNIQSVTLMARWLKMYGSQTEIQTLIDSWAKNERQKTPKNPQDEIRYFVMVGNLYSSVEAYGSAESWYRRAVEKSAQHYPLLARTLARQGRFEEALQLCQDAAAKDHSLLPLLTAAYLMLEGHPTEKDYERAEMLLGKAAETYRDQPELLNVLAAVRIQQLRIDEATVLLRRVIELRPRDPLAMNNLATLLAEQPGKLPEGKELLERAIALSGPQPGLLDLKGVILIAEGKPQEAIPLFEEACAVPQTDPRYCFHWAVAYQRTGNMKKAQEVLKRARGLNLDRQILTPGDKKLLAELELALNGKNP